MVVAALVEVVAVVAVVVVVVSSSVEVEVVAAAAATATSAFLRSIRNFAQIQTSARILHYIAVLFHYIASSHFIL